jgi:hypothetical protein
MLLALAGFILAGVPITCSAIRARRAQGLYAQWMEYEAPPHMVIYEEDPAAAAQLLSTGGGYFVMPDTEDKPPLTTETPVAHFPPEAKGLQAKIPGGCAFLHWLRRQDDESLVFVSLQLGPGDPAKRSTRTITFTPYKLTAAATASPAPAGSPYIMHLGRTDALRILAGQRDVGDASHLTLTYFKNGRPGTLHGVLQPEGTVILSPSRVTAPPPR